MSNQVSSKHCKYYNTGSGDDYYSSMDRWLDQDRQDEPWNPVNPRVSGGGGGGSGSGKSHGKKDSKSKNSSKSKSKSKSAKH